jgi:hypothetical protein
MIKIEKKTFEAFRDGLRIISENLNFSLNKELKKLNDKYFF